MHRAHRRARTGSATPWRGPGATGASEPWLGPPQPPSTARRANGAYGRALRTSGGHCQARHAR
eukprot:13928999-Alexandrium_andersonii.AAC.1